MPAFDGLPPDLAQRLSDLEPLRRAATRSNILGCLLIPVIWIVVLPLGFVIPIGILNLTGAGEHWGLPAVLLGVPAAAAVAIVASIRLFGRVGSEGVSGDYVARLGLEVVAPLVRHAVPGADVVIDDQFGMRTIATYVVPPVIATAPSPHDVDRQERARVEASGLFIADRRSGGRVRARVRPVSLLGASAPTK